MAAQSMENLRPGILKLLPLNQYADKSNVLRK